MPQYTLEEVKKHNKKTDVWIALHKKVYNVTKFVSEHPGGPDILMEAAGKDASSMFDDIGHSDTAKSLLKTYFIGDLKA